MPRAQISRNASLEVDRRRREQAITQAHHLFHKKGHTSAGAYLGEKLDANSLQQLLDELPDAGLLSNLDAPLSPELEHQAREALKRWATVLMVAYSAKRDALKANILLEQCFKTIHDRWSGIVAWILYFIQHIPVTDDTWNATLNDCVWIVKSVICDPEDDPLPTDMLSLPASFDVVLRLLEITNPVTGNPATLPLPDKPKTRCSIADLYGIYIMTLEGYQCVLLRLASLPQRATKAYSQHIVSRLQLLLTSPRGKDHKRQLSEDLFHLISPTCLLAMTTQGERDLGQDDVAFEGARVLLKVMEDTANDKQAVPDAFPLENCLNELVTLGAGWPNISTMARLAEGGIVPCLLRSLPHGSLTTPRGIEDPACRVIPFLTDSRVFRAAQQGGYNLALFDTLESSETSDIVKSIYNAYLSTLRVCISAFEDRKEKPLHLCSNLKHIGPPGISKNMLSVKRCASCHVAFYCSEQCQKADWVAFHSQECRYARSQHKLWKRASLTKDSWRDKLAYLEALANRFLPPYPELVRREKENATDAQATEAEAEAHSCAHEAAHTRINVFDLTGRNFDRRKPFKLVEYESMTISAYFKAFGEDLGRDTQMRILRCAEDAMRTPVSTALVAGAFIAQGVSLYVCTEMEYKPAAQLGDRYGVTSHVFDVCFRRS